MTERPFRLPRFGRSALSHYADEDMLNAIEEDLECRWEENLISGSFLKARGLLTGQIVALVLSFWLESILWRFAMLKNYIKVTFRHLKREKGYSFINIIGLAVGLACFILIGLWSLDELSFDRFHENRARLYRQLNRFESGRTNPSITYALAPALKAERPEVEAFSRVWPWTHSLVRNGDIAFEENNIHLADPDFFKMFTFPFIKGDPETALTDRNALVLTESAARRYFRGHDAVGQTLHITAFNSDFMVTGVIRDIPSNSHIQFELIGRVEHLGEDRISRWNESVGPSYILLREGISGDAFAASIADIYKERANPRTTTKAALLPLTKYYLYTAGGLGRGRTVIIFSLIAVFILMMACINFMNLSTARSAKRAREVGMRKVIGAGRSQIIRQFTGESLLLAAISMTTALIMVEAALPSFSRFTGKSLHLLSEAHLPVIGLLLLTTIATGFLAGVYPAFFLSSFPPVAVLKGRSPQGGKGAGIRKALIVFQFALSAGIIFGTLAVSRQMRHIRSLNLGIDRENVIILNFNPSLDKHFESFRSRLLSDPHIRNVTAAAQRPTQIGQSLGINWEGNPTDEPVGMDYTVADFDFFETFGMEITRGRSFSRDHPSDEREACIINETAARILGMKNPIGASLHMGHPAWPETFRTARIIGVVKDFHSRSLHNDIRPFVFRMYRPFLQYVFIKVDGTHIRKALENVEAAFKTGAPDYPFRFQFLDDFFNRQYISEQRLGSLFNVFSLLCILISCLGLFGLAAYTIEQKTKEIGIRKVLGASVRGIVFRTTGEFIKWVVIAVLISWPLAYFFMRRWLQAFAYKPRFGVVIFALSAGITLLISLAAVLFQSVKAAMREPMNSLRYE